MEPSDYAVDNASLGTADDIHPCGGWTNGAHALKPDGVCEDCGYDSREED